MKKPAVVPPAEPPYLTPDLNISTVLVLSGFSLITVEKALNVLLCEANFKRY